MKKKVIISLLLSSTIIIGAQIPVYAKGVTTGVGYKEVSTYSLDNYYIKEILYSNGYPMDSTINYNLVDLFDVNGDKTYVIDIYADDILLSGGRLTVTLYKFRDPYIKGISSEEVKSVMGTRWSEKVKISNQDAIYKARYAVYKNTLKDVLDRETSIEELSLVKVNGTYIPCYSLDVTYEETKECWNVLVNAQTSDVINCYKLSK